MLSNRDIPDSCVTGQSLLRREMNLHVQSIIPMRTLHVPQIPEQPSVDGRQDACHCGACAGWRGAGSDRGPSSEWVTERFLMRRQLCRSADAPTRIRGRGLRARLMLQDAHGHLKLDATKAVADTAHTVKLPMRVEMSEGSFKRRSFVRSDWLSSEQSAASVLATFKLAVGTRLDMHGCRPWPVCRLT